MNWPAVALEWDGIEILLPMGREAGNRTKIEWLDIDWAMTSGCAWRVSGIELKLHQPEPNLPSP
ncbi:hypothetical protein ACEUZ9_001137 [Paracoccus litorisediminis]|uniref:hypothetical protein n=1 Tax=Paracoccus litorisediminis TaxID=2006130 RepID=UPI00373475AF